jgi:hypothetical protein
MVGRDRACQATEHMGSRLCCGHLSAVIACLLSGNLTVCSLENRGRHSQCNKCQELVCIQLKDQSRTLAQVVGCHAC